VKRCRKGLDKKIRRWIFPTVRIDRKKLLPIETIFFVSLVFGLAVEFLGSPKAMRISDGENARLNVAAEQARTDAAESNERSKQLEAQNLVLRSNVLALEIKVQPRTITPNQHAILVEKLRRGVKGPVAVQEDWTYAEAGLFGGQILSVITDAGFETRMAKAQDTF